MTLGELIWASYGGYGGAYYATNFRSQLCLYLISNVFDKSDQPNMLCVLGSSMFSFVLTECPCALSLALPDSLSSTHPTPLKVNLRIPKTMITSRSISAPESPPSFVSSSDLTWVSRLTPKCYIPIYYGSNV